MRLQFLIDAVTDYAICMLDPEGHIAAWNSGAERIDGYTEAEIVGRHFSIFFTPEDRAAGEPARVLSMALAEGRYAIEAARVRKDGSRFVANVLIRPVFDDQNRHIGFARLIRDVTEARRTEEALRESERRLRLFIDSVSDYAIYMLDPAGTVTTWNAGAERIKGYTADEIIGRDFSVFYTPADQAEGRPQVALKIAAETGRFAAETWRVRKDGSIFAADVVIHAMRDDSGRLVGFAKITRDVTERRAAAQALAEAHEREAVLEERQRGLDRLRQTSQTLAKIVEASPLAIITIDSQDLIRIWNPAAERIYGLDAETVVGKRLTEVGALVPEVEPKEEPGLVPEARRHGSVHARETRRRRADGSIVELSRSAALILDGDGNPGGIVFVSEDVTQRNATERQLRQAQKMEAIGQLTGGIAHDFNNLLAIIHGNVELLRDIPPGDPSFSEMIDDALTAVRRGASLTHRLLAYSRQQQLAPIGADVERLATDLVTVLRRVMEESVQIESRIASDLWTIRIDVNQLENAVINLAVNARDAMPEGGRLTITAENAILDEDYAAEHSEVTAGRYVMISISDTGTGMPKEVLARAFQPFFTTKPMGRGTGLGLSMVFGFVKQSDGHMMIYSEPGHGTTVKLYLPRAGDEDEAAAPIAAAATPAASVPRGLAILVIEDDAAVRRLQLRMLQSLGCRTLEAQDGPSGLELLQSGERIDLVLSDIVLPGGMNGVAVAAAARRLRPGLKVIFSSGYAPNAVIRDDALNDATVLSKPFTRTALVEAIRRALAGETVGGAPG